MLKKANKININLTNINFFKNINLKEFNIFFWIVLISLLGILIYSIYVNDKKTEIKQIKSSLDNIYLIKTIKELTENLEPRYSVINYVSKSGDTYQSIINKLNIDKKEKKKITETILNEKSLKILKINQKFTFKFDHLSQSKIKQFVIETDKKNEIVFSKKLRTNEFDSKKL